MSLAPYGLLPIKPTVTLLIAFVVTLLWVSFNLKPQLTIIHSEQHDHDHLDFKYYNVMYITKMPHDIRQFSDVLYIPSNSKASYGIDTLKLFGMKSCFEIYYCSTSSNDLNLFQLYFYDISYENVYVNTLCLASEDKRFSFDHLYEYLLNTSISTRTFNMCNSTGVQQSQLVGRIDIPSYLLPLKNLYMPLVSIIIPVYNTQRLDWFCTTLRSVYAQSFQDFEVIIVNDGSYKQEVLYALKHLRHGTLKDVYGNYCYLDNNGNTKMKRLRVVDRVNGGLSAARNTGVRHAKGKYVLFIDPDDYMDPYCIEHLVMGATITNGQHATRLSDYKYAFVYPSVIHINESKSRHDGTSCDHQKFYGCSDGMKEDTVWEGEEVFAEYSLRLLKKQNFITSTALIDRSVYLHVGGMCSVNYYEDYEFWARMASLGYVGKLVQSAKFYYRRHPHGQSTSIRNRLTGEDYDEVKKLNPVLFGNMERKDVWEAARAGSAELRCYLSGQETLIPSPYNPLILNRASNKSCVLYIVPWLVTGGADYYDLEVIKTMSELGFNVILVTERHIPGFKQTVLEKASDFVESIWRLQQMSNSSIDHDFIIDYLVSSRKVEHVIIRASLAGYRAVSRWSCPSFKLRRDSVIVNDSYFKNIKAIDILHVQVPQDLSAWEWRSGLLAGKLWNRVVISENLKRYLVSNVIYGQDSSLIDEKRTSCDQYLFKQLLPADQQRIMIVPPPIVTEWPSPSDAQLLNQVVEPRILFIGRFEMQKDPFLWLMTAFSLFQEFSSTNKTIKFDMVGDGSLFEDTKKWAREKFPKSFYNPYSKDSPLTIHGKMEHSDIYKLLHSKTILLMTSRFEGVPMAALECASMGVPVAILDCSSRTGGGYKDFDADPGSDLWSLIRLVQPEWSKDALRDDFEGSACHFDYTKTSKRLSDALHSLLDTITHDRLSWYRRYQKAAYFRKQFSIKKFKQSWEDTLTEV
jgi:glycosyltransferase involved in cell wall biosynthesis